MSPTVANNYRALIALTACLLLVEDAFYADAAPSIKPSEWTVFPRSLDELLYSDAFDRIWRDAAKDQIAAKFGGGGGGGGQQATRNMVGDYMGSNEFQQALCKAGSQGMTSMGGMMGQAPFPGSSIAGTFVGSDKFQHGTCDMFSQGMIQFSSGVNDLFRSDVAAAAAAAADSDDARDSHDAVLQDPTQLVDEYFRSEYHENARKGLRNMFPDVRSWFDSITSLS